MEALGATLALKGTPELQNASQKWPKIKSNRDLATCCFDDLSNENCTSWRPRNLRNGLEKVSQKQCGPNVLQNAPRSTPKRPKVAPRSDSMPKPVSKMGREFDSRWPFLAKFLELWNPYWHPGSSHKYLDASRAQFLSLFFVNFA